MQDAKLRQTYIVRLNYREALPLTLHLIFQEKIHVDNQIILKPGGKIYKQIKPI